MLVLNFRHSDNKNVKKQWCFLWGLGSGSVDASSQIPSSWPSALQWSLMSASTNTCQNECQNKSKLRYFEEERESESSFIATVAIVKKNRTSWCAFNEVHSKMQTIALLFGVKKMPVSLDVCLLFFFSFLWRCRQCPAVGERERERTRERKRPLTALMPP